METIKLSKPLLVNGENRTEIELDFDAVSVDQFVKAEAYSRSKAPTNVVNLMEFDYGFHLYLAFSAATAADPSVDVADLERLTGPDLMAMARAGRNFTSGSSAGPTSEASESTEGTSEEPPASARES